MPIEAGQPAPSVTAVNQDGETVELSFEKPTVLYFYPRDDTPGCTTEAQQFDAELETYQEAGVDIYGVSTDDVDAHTAFVEKYDLDIDLLADPDGEIAAAFGVAIDESSHKADRTTFVLVDGTVHSVYTGVKPDGHARNVLNDLLDGGIVELNW